MTSTKTYLSDKQALAFYIEKATAKFWDNHWSAADLQTTLQNSKSDGVFIPAVKRHLPKESVVLKGGCGTGQIVHALQYQGYKAIGVDFTSQTIQKIKDAVPELDVRLGDVSALVLSDAPLDGYISVGMIEHFGDGYKTIIREMYRTLKIGGYLFVSFPYMSPLRRLKVALRMYPYKESHLLNDQQERFYQFAFTAEKVQADLESLGFQLKERIPFDGIKGFKDEVALFKPYLQQVYDGKRWQRWRRRLDKLFKRFASHCIILVMQKTEINSF